MIPDAFIDLLEKPTFAHLATLRPDGSPQSNPVWFVWDGERIRFSLTKTRKKARNLKHDPKCALSISDPENPYRYLEIRGTVESIDDDVDNRFIDAEAKRYLGVDQYPMHQPGDERIIVTVRPDATSQMAPPPPKD
jgi:PPOX class probable F420-dependent enzyme